jgi:NADH:ubiquinone oxidoreductase subunit 6 (subunit J)
MDNIVIGLCFLFIVVIIYLLNKLNNANEQNKKYENKQIILQSNIDNLSLQIYNNSIEKNLYEDMIRSLIIRLIIMDLIISVLKNIEIDVQIKNKINELTKKFGDELFQKYYINNNYKYQTILRDVEKDIRNKINIQTSTKLIDL